MVKRIQKLLSEKKFGIDGIKGYSDELKAERILERRRPVIEKHLTVFKKIEEKESQLTGDQLYVRDMAKGIDRMEGISYAQRNEIKEILGNKKLRDSDKASKIRWVFQREYHTRMP